VVLKLVGEGCGTTANVRQAEDIDVNRQPSAQWATSVGSSLVVAVGLAAWLCSSRSKSSVARDVLLVELRRGPHGVLFELVGSSALLLQCEHSDVGSARVTYLLQSGETEPPWQSGSSGDASVEERSTFCKLVDFKLRDSRGKLVRLR
jgi:hypothetical protein